MARAEDSEKKAEAAALADLEVLEHAAELLRLKRSVSPRNSTQGKKD